MKEMYNVCKDTFITIGATIRMQMIAWLNSYI